jgi:hypothetical protein
MDKELHELAKSLVNLQKEVIKLTLAYWKPEAEKIINSESKDINRIEHTLDALCEVAFDEEVLKVFKSLCRYYYNIDPLATAEHVDIYREMWDNEEENDSEK